MAFKERFEYIDALRGIAIAAVIIAHCGSLTAISGVLRSFTALGGMGVQLFFVISAFTIFYTLDKNSFSPTLFRDFFIKRLFRIIPIYWLGIILYTAVYGLSSRGWLDGPELWHYPFHIFLVNVLHPLTSSSVVPGGWSISCEVLFYMMVPLLYMHITSKKRMAIFFIITLVVLPVINHYLKLYTINTIFSDIDRGVVDMFFYRWIFNQLGSFGFGILLYFVYKDGRYTKYISSKNLNFIFIIVCTLLIILLKSVPQQHIVYSFLFMVIALILSVYPWKLYVNKFTVFLGKISFSSYLLHFLVIKQASIFMTSYMPNMAGSSNVYFAIITIVTFAFTMPLAYLSYRFIELNAVVLGRFLMKRLDKNSVQASVN